MSERHQGTLASVDDSGSFPFRETRLANGCNAFGKLVTLATGLVTNRLRESSLESALPIFLAPLLRSVSIDVVLFLFSSSFLFDLFDLLFILCRLPQLARRSKRKEYK